MKKILYSYYVIVGGSVQLPKKIKNKSSKFFVLFSCKIGTILIFSPLSLKNIIFVLSFLLLEKCNNGSRPLFSGRLRYCKEFSYKKKDKLQQWYKRQNLWTIKNYKENYSIVPFFFWRQNCSICYDANFFCRIIFFRQKTVQTLFLREIIFTIFFFVKLNFFTEKEIVGLFIGLPSSNTVTYIVK